MERVVEQVAVADREGRGPVEVGEDPERHRLRPAPHQHRPDEAERQDQRDARAERPGDMVAQTERARAAEGAQPPQDQRRRHEEARELPPAALGERDEQCEPPFGPRRLEREPGQLADELDRVPVDAGHHVEADDLEREEGADQRRKAELAEVDRSDLRRAELARPIIVGARLAAHEAAGAKRGPGLERPPQLHLGEDVLVAHDRSPLTTRSAG